VVKPLARARRFLSHELYENDAISLGAVSDTLKRLMPTLEEELLPTPLAVLDAFATQLERLALQFDVFRRFRDVEADSLVMGTPERQALLQISNIIGELPDRRASDEVKAALSEAAVPPSPAASPIAEAAWRGSISNIARALTQPIRKIALEIGTEARKELIKRLGQAVVVSLPVSALALLARLYPEMFGPVAGVWAALAKLLHLS
jgi:hypothetical protein